MRPPGRTPTAITAYDNMPGYGAASLMARELLGTARRIGHTRYALDRALAEKSVRTLLTTAEAGARLAPRRRGRLYRAAWTATHDCDAILDTATQLRLLRPEPLMAARATIRQTQQAVTIATGVMIRRQKNEAPGP